MRLYQIIEELLQAHDYLSLYYLMKKTDVSKRTLQNDISYLMQVSSRKGYQIHMRRGSGYLLEVTNHELFSEFITELKEDSGYATKNRANDILAYLAIQDGYITMDMIANEMSISRTSVKNYMNDVEQIAHHYHVQLERKSHYGVRLDGDSLHFKGMLCELYFNENTFIVKQMEDIEKNFDFVKDILIREITKEKLNINYNELRNVMVWLQVNVFYITHLNKGEKKSGILDIKINQSVSNIAKAVKEAMETIYDIQIKETCLCEMKEILQKNLRLRESRIIFGDRLEEDVRQFLKEVDTIYNTNFQKDEDFCKLLLVHVSLLIDRLHQKISYKNTLADEICIRYPMIFNLAIQFADMLKEKYGVVATHDEIGFVATHFAAHMERESINKIRRFNKIGVVCSSGGGGAYLIKMQIQSIFPNAEVETFSFLNLNLLEEFHPDLIFTIMPLIQEIDAPIIYIKELLNEDDLMRIRQILQYDNYNTISIKDANDYIFKIFQREHFSMVDKGEYRDIIKEMAEQIEREGYGGEHYVDYVLERESYMSTVYLNGVAIPHPIQMCSKKNLVSVVIPKHEVYVNDKRVNIIFMIALTKDDYEMHKDITKRLYQLMQNEVQLQRVISVNTFEELIIVLNETNGGTV
ncbi:BglG family transcription antiterminator [Amedibacillus sp. YH-ame6]